VETKVFKTRITELLGIKYPIVQGGMRFIGRAELAAAVANAGGIGFISAHTQPTAEDLRREIQRAQSLTKGPIGVNLTVLPMLKGVDFDAYVRVIIECGVKAAETAGANPAKYIGAFKEAGVKVVHKCTTVRHAVKAEQLGADAISIDSFECAGHPGEDDVPGFILIPAAAAKVKIPMLASGGIADGKGMVAAMALGAEGINMGTRFMLTQESPLHPAVKQLMLQAGERDTVLIGRTFKDSSRLLKNKVVEEALALEHSRPGVTYADVYPLVGAPRWMKAAAEGDLEGGAFPAGMCVGLINDLPTCAELIANIMKEAETIVSGMSRKFVAA
jgi:NAD(P)H-dependent flavin oxidoreductase YrpB (nitropropane dioxygenase family)